MSQNFVRSARIGAAFAGLTLVFAIVVGAPLGMVLLVLGGAAILLAVPGVVLRWTLPAEHRAAAGGGAGWPWTLPLRKIARSRTVGGLSLLVKDVEGGEHRCVAQGEWAPAAPASGVVVEVYGRRDKTGDVRVRRLAEVDTGDVVTPRLPGGARLGRAAGFLAVALWGGAALALLALSILPR
ncbi:hypothetical protein [Amycolatopsis oliviviridis]|nr:hypothetical protein [Amycolatopsis oliviviridis]